MIRTARSRRSKRAATRGTAAEPSPFPPDPLWYKDAIIYQVHVRAFADSDDDGIGDFRGLAGKLDYLRDLGVTAIWLQPFYPSPLRDDGYDIADYTGLHPDYGTLADFKHFLREAHRRGLRVIIELVLNHTSDQHPWFQAARRARPGSKARDFYVWSDTPDRYTDARIIFKDFEQSNWEWDRVAKAYYWHRFYGHQPDLNYDNPAVKEAVFHAVDFWLSMGVDGLRLDAVPYLYERENTSCENLPETHELLRDLRRFVDARFPDRMLLAEANQWPDDAAAYFGSEDECHMAFHFPLMPRMFMAVRTEDNYPIIDILSQTPAIPPSCQWAIFLRNHDELTLEMVTDEERDYMYRVYAMDPRARINLGIRRRLAPLLSSDRRRIELMDGLLLSMPGTPIVYYGDEIGMGDNIYLGDRNGVRTPMQWSSDRNAGFSRANAQRLYLPVIIDPNFHYESLNVEAQQQNTSSLLWWTRKMINLRKRYRALGRGTIEFLRPENRKVLAFLRAYEEERILVVANLSRHSQFVELDLSRFRGSVPIELLGDQRFPQIGRSPYFLTLTPYSFFWFSLEPRAKGATTAGNGEQPVPSLQLKQGWPDVLYGDDRPALEALIQGYLRERRWFAGKARTIESTRLVEVVPLGNGEASPHLVLARVEYADEEAEIYQLVLGFHEGAPARELERSRRRDVIARLVTPNGEGVLVPALREPAVCSALLDAVDRRRAFKGMDAEVRTFRTRAFKELRGDPAQPLAPRLAAAEQSNTSIHYGERLALKLFRRVEEGVNPEQELGRFLTEHTKFKNVARLAGALEYVAPRGRTISLGVLQEFVPNQGDGWTYTLDLLSRYFERIAPRVGETPPMSRPGRTWVELAREPLPDPVYVIVGYFISVARLLGRRTAELHAALSSRPDDPEFKPEPFTPMYQRSLYQSMRNETVRVLEILRKGLRRIPPSARRAAESVVARESDILDRFARLRGRRISAVRTRIHGDYHLAQVLHTGKDFVIVDFEGEPAHSMTARRIKRSPLRDVAGMLRSFDYAGHTALLDRVTRGEIRPDEMERFFPWVKLWVSWVSAAFLGAYLERATPPGRFVPADPDDTEALLEAYLVEKAIYEIGYEMNNRPAWLRIPLMGLLDMLPERK